MSLPKECAIEDPTPNPNPCLTEDMSDCVGASIGTGAETAGAETTGAETTGAETTGAETTGAFEDFSR